MTTHTQLGRKHLATEIRDERRRSIIAAAETLFLQHDLGKVTMKDISTAAGITKATLYKYFASIDEVAFEVQIKVYSMMFEPPNMVVTAPADARTSLNGREIVRQYLRTNLEFAQHHPEHVRYLGVFDHHYRDCYPTRELEHRYKVIVNRVTARHLSLLNTGILDGSIRNDIDPNLMASAVWNILISMLQRMALRGPIILQESGVEPDRVLEVVLDMIVRYLSP